MIEPGKVKADGNCFFQAVAMAINTNGKYVGEDLVSMLRLHTVIEGTTRMDYFIQKVLLIIQYILNFWAKYIIKAWDN